MVAPVIKGTAILPFAAGGGDRVGARVPLEIAAGDVHDIGGLVGGIDLTRIETIVEMHAAIEPPARRADLKLRMLGIEAFDQRTDFVGDVVAIGVLEEEHL